MELRSYQKSAVSKMKAFFEKSDGKEASQVVMATGTGKTEVFLSFLSELKEMGIQTRCLILERQIDLVKQTSERAKKYFPTLNIEQWYDGEVVTPETKDYIVVSTAQTLSKYLLPTILDVDLFDIIIVDECHHANINAHQITSICDYFNYRCCYGFTATPAAISRLFHQDNILFYYSILDGQREGYLLDDKNIHYHTLNVPSVSEFGGLGEYEKAIEIMVTNKRTHCLWYCKDTIEVERLTQVMKNKSLPYYVITSGTPERDRIKYINDFKKSEKIHLININICNEGIDIPEIETIIIAKPIESENLFKQIIGRGIRLAPNKKDLFIYDLCHGQNNYYKMYTSFQIEPLIFAVSAPSLRERLGLTDRKIKKITDILSKMKKEDLEQVLRIEAFDFNEVFCYPELCDYEIIYKDNYAYLSGCFPNESNFYFRMKKCKDGTFFIEHNCYGVEGYKKGKKTSSLEKVKQLLEEFEKQNVRGIKRNTNGTRTPPSVKQLNFYCQLNDIKPNDLIMDFIKTLYSTNTMRRALNEKVSVNKIKNYFTNRR